MNSINPKTNASQKINYTSCATENIFKEFNTSLNGLTDAEAKKRLRKYGPNVPSRKKKIPAIIQFLSKFLNPLALVLAIIALFSLFFGEKISAVFVGLMILISVTLEFFLEYRSGKAEEKLSNLVRAKVSVFRDNAQKEADIFSIVPGDIIDLYAGDMIPADLRIIRAKDLFINQSSLTGESFPVEKTSAANNSKNFSLAAINNMAFMGSSVVSGIGLGIVIKTGASTQFGEISGSLARIEEETSFDRGIKQFTMLIIRLMLILVIFIFFIIIVLKQGFFKDALLFSLAVAVGITPEMLPMLVTINLSRGAIDMAKKKGYSQALKFHSKLRRHGCAVR